MGYIVTGCRKARGNQYIHLVKVLYCKLATNGKQLPVFPHELGLFILYNETDDNPNQIHLNCGQMNFVWTVCNSD